MIKLRSTERLSYICSFDSAVDQDASDLDKYRDTLDEKYLKLVDGGLPTKFNLRRLTQRQLQHCRSQEHPSKGAEEAIAFGLVSAENFDVELRHKKTDLGERLQPECLEKVCGPSELLYELGGAILKLSGLAGPFV